MIWLELVCGWVSGLVSSAAAKEKYKDVRMLTSHFHATDCTERFWTGSDDPLYDIETGSLVSSPCTYRQVCIEDGILDIDTVKITDIDYNTGAATFQEYARD
jgi:hypothetical protein